MNLAHSKRVIAGGLTNAQAWNLRDRLVDEPSSALCKKAGVKLGVSLSRTPKEW